MGYPPYKFLAGAIKDGCRKKVNTGEIIKKGDQA